MSQLAAIPDLPIRRDNPPASAARGRGRNGEPASFDRQLRDLAADDDAGDRGKAVKPVAAGGKRREEGEEAPRVEGKSARPEVEEKSEKSTEPAVVPLSAGTPTGAAVPVDVAEPAAAAPATGRTTLERPDSGVNAVVESLASSEGGTGAPSSLDKSGAVLAAPPLPGKADAAPAPPATVDRPIPPADGNLRSAQPMPVRAAEGGRKEAEPLPFAAVSVPSAQPSSSALQSASMHAAGTLQKPSISEPPVPERGFLSEQRLASLLNVRGETTTTRQVQAAASQGETAAFDTAEENIPKPMLPTTLESGAPMENGAVEGESLSGPFGRLLESAGRSEPAANEPIQHLPSGRTVPERSIVQQIVTGIPLPRGDAPNHLKLRLQPEELGEVTVEVRLEKEGVKAHLQVQNAQVLEVLEKHLPRLREALQEQGVRLDEMRLSADAQGGNGFTRDRHPASDHRASQPESIATAEAPVRHVPLPLRAGAGLSIRI